MPPLQIHPVEHLFLHVSVGDGAGALQQAVSQGAFAVVNMSNNTKVSNVCLIH